ncbi:MAG: hypothetical protein Q9195_008028 [Heterodermia aff. obscurata]
MSDADVRSRKRKLSELSEHESSPHYSPPLPQPSQHRSKPPLDISSLEGLSKVDPKPETAIKEPSHSRAPFNTTPQQGESHPLLPKWSAAQHPPPPSVAAPISTHPRPQSQPWLQSWLQESAGCQSPDQPISLPSTPKPPASPPDLEVISSESLIKISPPIPLTTRNLRVHDSGDMASTQRGKATSSSHQPLNLTRLHLKLLKSNMKVHNMDDWAKFQDIIKKCKTLIMDESKDSVMSDASAQKALRYRRQYIDQESSFLMCFLYGAVIKLDSGALVQDSEGQVDETWLKGGIYGVSDVLFLTSCIADLTDKTPKDKLTTDPKVALTIPKPDLAYGFSLFTFSDEENSIMEDYADLFCVCPTLVWVFFIIECKAYRQSIENAGIQASRGAAALMCAQRQLDVLTGSLQDQNQVNQRSRVFSMCISPQVARMNVHWIAASDEGVLKYYLHHVRYYHLEMPEEIKQLRRDIWSVMEWGMEFHRPKVIETIEALKGKDNDAIWLREDASSPSKKRRASKD